MSAKRKPKRVLLRNVSAEDVILEFYKRLDEDRRTVLKGETFDQPYSISELMHEEDKKNATYFVDPHKNVRKYWIHMIGVHDHNSLPLVTSKPCWWCQHEFRTRPIGAPIEYFPHEADGPLKAARENALVKSNLPCDTNDFFLTDGLFCSFPCVKAFVSKPQENPLQYADSLTLLPLLYTKLTGKEPIVIPEAGSWRLLTRFLGHLSIEEFRQTFGKLKYVETPNSKRPYMYTCSAIIQECKTGGDGEK